MLTKLGWKYYDVETLIIISKNRLAALYDEYPMHSGFYPSDFLVNLIDKKSYQLVSKNYSTRNIPGINRVLFGEESTEMTVVLDEIDLGVIGNKKITAYYTGGPQIKFREQDIEGSDGLNGLEKIRLKLELAGKSDVRFYDWGYTCQDVETLKYVNASKCIALHMNGNTKLLKDVVFDDVYFDTINLRNIYNTKINSLNQPRLNEIKDVDIDVNSMVMSYASNAKNTKIKVNKARYIEIGAMENSELEFNSVHQLVICGYLRHCKLVINCDLTNDTINLEKARNKMYNIFNTEIIFNGRINVKVLNKLARTLIFAPLLHALFGTAKIVVPEKHKQICLDGIDEIYHEYLEFRG